MSENIMAGLATDNSIKNETDSLGGFQVFDSGLYTVKIEKAFITFAKSKAMAFNVWVKTPDGKSLQQIMYVTSGEAKGCKNHYVNKKTGEKHYLPGFNTANAICLLSIGKELASLDTEPGLVELYGEKTKVELIPALVGQEITLGVIKQLVDKRAKNQETGEYEATGESRSENEIDKVFRAKDGLTTTEIRAKIDVSVFRDKWLEKWEGQVKDKTTDATGPAGTAEGAPPAKATGNSAPTEALFQ
jgi:hypothetical protein